MFLKLFKDKSNQKYINRILNSRISNVRKKRIESVGVLLNLEEFSDYDALKQFLKSINVLDNKVKFIAPFVSLIHGVDSLKLLKEINKRAEQNNRIIDCLLQVHITSESTKFGFGLSEVTSALNQAEEFKNIRITGLMGMATFTDDTQQVVNEFKSLKTVFDSIKNEHITTLSMGMSGDYKLAIEQGSTMIRVGSAIFGHRNK